MLTTVPHGLDSRYRGAAEPRCVKSEHKNNELQIYGLTWFYITSLLRQGGSASYALPDDGGVRGLA